MLQKLPFEPLRGAHRATPSKLCIVEAVDEMRRSDHEVEVQGPVLTVFKGAKTIQDKELGGGDFRAKFLVKEQGVPTEAFGEMLNRAVGDFHLTSDLAKSGAGHESLEERREKLPASKPIGG